MSISKIVSDVKSIVQRMRTLSRKIQFHTEKAREYTEERDILQKRYEDLVTESGVDLVIKERGGTR